MKGTHKELLVKKGAIMDELREKVDKASILIFTDYRGNATGLTVKQISELRSKLREQNAEFKIAKNSLIAKILHEKGIEGFDSYLENPTALVLGYGDPIAAVKAIMEYSKSNKNSTNPSGMPLLKAANFESHCYDGEGVKKLSLMPSRPEVLAQLLSLINTPARKVMGALQASSRDLVNILDQYSKKTE